jgi:hypothetical protein
MCEDFTQDQDLYSRAKKAIWLLSIFFNSLMYTFFGNNLKNRVNKPRSPTTRICSALKIQLLRHTTPSTLLYPSKRRHVQEDLSLVQHRCEKLKQAPALPSSRGTT